MLALPSPLAMGRWSHKKNTVAVGCIKASPHAHFDEAISDNLTVVIVGSFVLAPGTSITYTHTLCEGKLCPPPYVQLPYTVPQLFSTPSPTWHAGMKSPTVLKKQRQGMKNR